MTDLQGGAILLKYLGNLILLPIYQKIMVMCICCLRDVYETPCSTAFLMEGPGLFVAVLKKTGSLMELIFN